MESDGTEPDPHGEKLTGPEPLAAAVAVRDPAQVMIQPKLLPSAVAFAPDGVLLALASHNVVLLYDAARGRAIRVLTGGTGAINDVAFSPDGVQLAAASGGGTALLWDLTGLGPAAIGATLGWHDGAVLGVAYSPDGTKVATASADRTARIWDISGAEPVTWATLRGHAAQVTAMAFAPDGTLLATASADGTARLWNLIGAEPFTDTNSPAHAALHGHTASVRAVASLPTGPGWPPHPTMAPLGSGM